MIIRIPRISQSETNCMSTKQLAGKTWLECIVSAKFVRITRGSEVYWWVLDSNRCIRMISVRRMQIKIF